MSGILRLRHAVAVGAAILTTACGDSRPDEHWVVVERSPLDASAVDLFDGFTHIELSVRLPIVRSPEEDAVQGWFRTRWVRQDSAGAWLFDGANEGLVLFAARCEDEYAREVAGELKFEGRHDEVDETEWAPVVPGSAQEPWFDEICSHPAY